MTKITLECCDGLPDKTEKCLKDKCPNYCKAQNTVERGWGHVGSGFGNIYGYPVSTDIWQQVRKDLGITIPKDPTLARLQDLQKDQTELKTELSDLLANGNSTSSRIIEIRKKLMQNRLGNNGLRRINNLYRDSNND